MRQKERIPVVKMFCKKHAERAVLRPNHTDQKRKRKRNFSLMFVTYTLIFLIIFDLSSAFDWCE